MRSAYQSELLGAYALNNIDKYIKYMAILKVV